MSNSFGLAGLTKIPGAVYNVEQDGFATYDKSYSGVLGSPVPFLQGDYAAEHPNCVLLTIRIKETGEACSHIQVDLHYEGKDTSFAGPITSQNISVDFTTSQEPIESNINFGNIGDRK